MKMLKRALPLSLAGLMLAAAPQAALAASPESVSYTHLIQVPDPGYSGLPVADEPGDDIAHVCPEAVL